MAELFLARDTRRPRFAVLKRILPYLAEESEFLSMFLDEARIASMLHHPSVVEVFELGQYEGSTFIAMEWVDGIDLRDVLSKEEARGGVVPAGVAAWVVARLCEGLGYAHERTDEAGRPIGIIHRDISPRNVMVSFSGEVKLVDFGIAKATAWVSRSKPGVIKGKFLYLAPEQLGQEPIDHRVDLFALGTLLYELSTGASPFSRNSTEATIYAVRKEDPPAPHHLRAGYPRGLSRIVMTCLQKDRRRRYQSAAEIRADLETFLRAEAPTTSDDVLRYLQGLFGTENERTMLHVPDNVHTPEEEPAAATPAGRTAPLPPVKRIAQAMPVGFTTPGSGNDATDTARGPAPTDEGGPETAPIAAAAPVATLARPPFLDPDDFEPTRALPQLDSDTGEVSITLSDGRRGRRRLLRAVSIAAVLVLLFLALLTLARSAGR